MERAEAVALFEAWQLGQGATVALLKKKANAQESMIEESQNY